eukprot:TRINITY_DN15805_c0_g1_i7.p1 TRINITY_DN15805_c0_g1~~TRINITY_DN15805_c0_g1_i7.p1  ORF type:complete len:620 (+),score=27.97 TRINITY_DN15805_c0_g1_i7:150-2009(+)
MKPQPQLIRGVAVWPEYCGITVAQFGELLDECRASQDWSDDCNTYRFVASYVNPITAGTGLCYALLVNQDKPLEVSVTVTHAWEESVLGLYQALRRTLRPDDVVFITAFGLYQCEDGAGPTICQQTGSRAIDSPIIRVLRHKHHRNNSRIGWLDMVAVVRFKMASAILALVCVFWVVTMHACIPTHTHCARGVLKQPASWIPILTWQWTYIDLPDSDTKMMLLAEVLVLTAILTAALQAIVERMRGYDGKVLVVPNHNGHVTARMFSNFELFAASVTKIPVTLAKTLASLGVADSRQARCFSSSDEYRMRDIIEAYGEYEDEGYNMIDRTIRELARAVYWYAARKVVFVGVPLALVDTCIVRVVMAVVGLSDFGMTVADKNIDKSWQESGTGGRLAYDFLCEATFQEGSYVTWAWLLALGIILGIAVVVGVVTGVAKRARGRTTVCDWLKVVVVFIMVEALLFIASVVWKSVGYCGREFHAFTWFLLGFAAMVAQGALLILLSMTASLCCGHWMHRCNPLLIKFLPYLVVAGLVVIVVATGPKEMSQVYPTVVFNVGLLFSSLIGPLYMVWSSVSRWSVQLRWPGRPGRYYADLPADKDSTILAKIFGKRHEEDSASRD